MAPIKLDLKTATLATLRALALSVARDIDRGEDQDGTLRQELERIFEYVPTAPEARFQ